MENELKMCKEILKKVKWYMERKDYSGLRLYIEEREKYVKKELTTDEEKSKIKHVASQKKIRTDYKKKNKKLKKVVDSITQNVVY